MKYYLRKLNIGASNVLEITEEEYHKIQKSKYGLIEALHIEEKFDVLIENYQEFESDLFDTAVQYMVSDHRNYSWFQMEDNKINRRLINLLSACRLYVDHIPHHLSNIYGKESEQKSKFDELKSKYYNQKLGYRVLEAIRNYVQHRGFPVHSITYHMKRQDSKYENEHSIKYALTTFLKISTLEQDGKFKSEILKELKKIYDEKIDLKPLVRQYIGSLGEIHKEVRDMIELDLFRWEEILNKSIDDYLKTNDEENSALGLAAVEMESEREVKNSIPLSKEFNEHRKLLEGKNGNLSSLDLRYITSEPINREKSN